jgi:hypothetical protein
LIQKLFAGAAVVAVAVVALLLASVGTSSAKPAEANVSDIGATMTSVGVNTYALVKVNADDDFWDFPNNLDDVDITASAGEWVEIDPTFQPPFSGCSDNGFSPSSFRCDVNSNGFGNSNTFAPNPGAALNTTAVFADILTTLGFFTGNTHIQVCNFHPQAVTDPALCDNNTTHIEAWWQAPPGFLGGTVTFCAKQTTNYVCDNITVVGPVASLKVFAFRDKEGDGSNETTVCKDTPVYIIASRDYSFNNLTTFDNNRAVLCVEARDSNGSTVSGANLVWTTTKGALGAPVTVSGSNVDTGSNILTSGGSAVSGDVATVRVANGAASATVDVAFGDDPASCMIPDFAADLDIGDTANVVATFYDPHGNLVPDGIVVHFVEVDSGDGDNLEFVTTIEDTVKGVASAKVIAAIAGLSTVAAVTETIGPGPGDATCSEALDLSGDIHVTPVECEDDADFILYGSKPPAGGGFGTFLFCGGTNAQLLAAAGCPASTPSTVVFYYNKPSGGYAVWVVGSDVAAVNAEWLSLFPNEHIAFTMPTIVTAKCK